MGFLDKLGPQLLEDWKVLEKAEQLDEIKQLSFDHPVVIFKHSVSCGISAMAKHKLESSWDFPADALHFFYLDLLANRSVSNLVAETFGVVHQSPQILVIRNGEAVYDTSHHMVSTEAIKKAI